jgi:hypothetical protein
MQTLGPAQAPPSDEQLIAQLKGPLKTLLEIEVEGEVDPDKIVQYARAKLNTLLWKNIQWVAPFTNPNGMSDYRQVSGNNGNAIGAGSFDYTQNIFRGFGRKFVAVLGTRAPNVKARANDPDNEDSVNATRMADDANAIIDSWFGVDELNIDCARIVFTTGPAFIHTHWVADGDKYGWREEPNLNSQPQPMGEPYHHCMNCGADSPAPQNGNCPQCQQPMGPESQVDPEQVDTPVQSGTTKYPNGQVECCITDCTTTTIPFYTKKLRDCPWIKYEFEENKGILLDKFPELAGQNLDEEGDTDSAQGRAARDAAISMTGGPLRENNTRWLFTRIWLQKSQYSLVKNRQVRQLLKDNYPDGLKITRVQEEIVRLENEKLDAVWAVIKPEAGETINCDAIGQDLVSPQILKNHMTNIAAQTFERGIPQTVADPRVFNFKAWNSRRAQPAEVIPTLSNTVTESIKDSFFELPAASFSAQQEPWLAGHVEEAITIIGTTPQIFGDGNAPTARQAEINKNAAIQQLSPTWTGFRKGWEHAKYNAVLQLAKYGSGVVQGGSKMLDLAELSTEGWRFEADEAIPGTWGQRRDLLELMLEKGPDVQQKFGLNSPSNIVEATALLSFPTGWKTPGVDDLEKVKATIRKLLQAAPIQKPNPDGSTDTQPSIPIDTFEDDPALVATYIKEWSQKQSLPGGVRETNPQGYSNTIAYGLASFKLANPPAPPPAPPQPKLTVSANLKDLPAQTGDALFHDFSLNVPPSPPVTTPQNLPISHQADLVKTVAGHQLAPPPVAPTNGAPAPGGPPPPKPAVQ